jgi:Predicted AAA-ATPase
VDKTELIHRLINDEMYYFLSRPRRFGKSLLVSTLAALFRGERELFEGTWIADSDYKFPKHPVIHLDFSLVDVQSPEGLTSSLLRLLSDTMEELGVQVEVRSRPSEALVALVRALSKKQKVVLLIDEYDRPLVRHVDSRERMDSNRQVLHDFFVALKTLQADLRFVLLTGVSRFSKVSLFSGLNSLTDISLDERYATLIGLTEGEIQDQFGERVRELAGENGIDDLRRWYNGYRFARSSTAGRVYNPWSVFNFLRQGLFENYWFESATPTFAIKLMRKQQFPLTSFEKGVRVGPEIEQNFDVDGLPVVALLF